MSDLNITSVRNFALGNRYNVESVTLPSERRYFIRTSRQVHVLRYVATLRCVVYIFIAAGPGRITLH